MRSKLLRVVLVGLGLAATLGAECTSECSGERDSIDGTATLVPGGSSSAVLTTPAAAKDCHATFKVVASYTGADLTNPALPEPMLIASAHAVGVLGEQPGLVGVFGNWAKATDPATGEITWHAAISAAARNVEATAVQYGIIINLATPETRPVKVALSIAFNRPAAESGE